MKRSRILIPAVLVVFATVSLDAKPEKKTSQTPAQKRVARGKYLVTVAGCHDCHSPKKDLKTMALDESRLLSGRPASTKAASKRDGEIGASLDLTAWHGPWGVSYSANLTPDKETGLGARYTEAKFIAAMRTGKKPEGEPILPPMPWPMIGQMTDEDLKSVYAYLQTLKPVKNFVRDASAPVPKKK